MKEHKKYRKTLTYGEGHTREMLQKGDIITITEKLDGTNVSFYKDGNEILCSSRKYQLDGKTALTDFYDWVQNTIKAEQLLPNVRYFGEWLSPHKVTYKDEYINQFYLFAIYDEATETYLDDETIQNEANRLGLNLVPYFYHGEFQSIEHIQSFVGKSNMSVDKGEGIVIKNIHYRDNANKQTFIKMVCEDFEETKRIKPHDPNRDIATQIADATVTVPRVRKMILQKRDEGIALSTCHMSDMGVILKTIGKDIIEDIRVEENELFTSIDEKLVTKAISKQLGKIVKEIILSGEI